MSENKVWKSEAEKPVMEGGLQYHIRCGNGDVERYCLLPGDPERSDMIADMWDEKRFVANYREHRTFSGKIGGAGITVCSTGAGSGSTTSAIEEVIALGADTLIRVGSCGAIQEYIDCGDVIIHSGAVRHDGSSNLYVDQAYPAFADYMVTAALVEAAEQLDIPYHIGVSCSTGSWYCGQGRPGYNNYTQSFFEHKVEDLRKAGVMNFEMETSALFTLCGLYGKRAGSVCTAFANRKKDQFQYGGIERSIQVANRAVEILYKWDQEMARTGKKHWYPSLTKDVK
ncbi:MAG TPA: nucleoside phosphorylase [Candidatus Lachnoclostridium stercoravium]|uniref:Nucleoside phosphorylase n=1 Tax=Candidatus Lachnoclostridium stercoravium TaxID=2838633 RepID=A0A9D2HIZ6_9FIRM|nr:nucleoside phosphorylase [Candidatus Lachnoclostridium stercoravium]